MEKEKIIIKTEEPSSSDAFKLLLRSEIDKSHSLPEKTKKQFRDIIVKWVDTLWLVDCLDQKILLENDYELLCCFITPSMTNTREFPTLFGANGKLKKNFKSVKIVGDAYIRATLLKRLYKESATDPVNKSQSIISTDNRQKAGKAVFDHFNLHDCILGNIGEQGNLAQFYPEVSEALIGCYFSLDEYQKAFDICDVYVTAMFASVAK